MNLGIDSRTVYEVDFENKFLAESAEFYKVLYIHCYSWMSARKKNLARKFSWHVGQLNVFWVEGCDIVNYNLNNNNIMIASDSFVLRGKFFPLSSKFPACIS